MMLNSQTTFSGGKASNPYLPVCDSISMDVINGDNTMKRSEVNNIDIAKYLFNNDENQKYTFGKLINNQFNSTAICELGGFNKKVGDKFAKVLNNIDFTLGVWQNIKIFNISVKVRICDPMDHFKDFVFEPFLQFFVLKDSGKTSSILQAPISVLTTNKAYTADKKYIVYCHHAPNRVAIGDLEKDSSKFKNEYLFYHGMTGRGLWIRMNEHKNAYSNFGKLLQEQDSKRLKPSTFKQNEESDVFVLYFHTLVANRLTKQEALDLEGELINQYSLFPNGNNMLPGGIKGREIIKKFGFSNYEQAVDTIDQSVNDPSKLEKLCAKKYNWEPLTDEQKANMVCHNPNNFSKKEVRFIRICSLSMECDCVNSEFKGRFKEYRYQYIKDRIEKVINGVTYRFVT